MNDYINYYDLLEINRNASSDEIKKAYRNQAKKWHPDLNKDPKAPEMAKKINEAKEILLDETKRREYDNYLDNYKNNIYENIDKRDNTQKENNKQYNNQYKKQYTNSYYEEKTYTKWEFFDLYLKYYKKSKPRKVLACVLVFLETLFCLLLEVINYLVAYLIAILGYYVSIGLLIFGAALLLLMILKPMHDMDLPPYNSFDYIKMGFGSVISIICSFYIKELLHIFTNKTPVLISKLNLYLFKKSIGYNKNDF